MSFRSLASSVLSYYWRVAIFSAVCFFLYSLAFPRSTLTALQWSMISFPVFTLIYIPEFVGLIRQALGGKSNQEEVPDGGEALPGSESAWPDLLRAERLIRQGKMLRAEPIALSFATSDDAYEQNIGYVLLGCINEKGGEGRGVDLPAALKAFREASTRVPDAGTYKCLARVSIKLKDFENAIGYLAASRRLRDSIEVLLGYGLYYESLEPADREQAKRYYLKAAKRGAMNGLVGYSRVARAGGEWLRALAVDVLRVVIALPVFMVSARRACAAF